MPFTNDSSAKNPKCDAEPKVLLFKFSMNRIGQMIQVFLGCQSTNKNSKRREKLRMISLMVKSNGVSTSKTLTVALVKTKISKKSKMVMDNPVRALRIPAQVLVRVHRQHREANRHHLQHQCQSQLQRGHHLHHQCQSIAPKDRTYL
jgi:hypothetical protein